MKLVELINSEEQRTPYLSTRKIPWKNFILQSLLLISSIGCETFFAIHLYNYGIPINPSFLDVISFFIAAFIGPTALISVFVFYFMDSFSEFFSALKYNKENIKHYNISVKQSNENYKSSKLNNFMRNIL